MHVRSLFFAAAVWLLLPLAAAGAVPKQAGLARWDGREMLASMQAELERNAAGLRMEEQQPPYFIAYRINEGRAFTVQARYGAVFNRAAYHGNRVYVEVRVGDYAFDNLARAGESADHLPWPTPRSSQLPYAGAPLEPSDTALRNILWMMTDDAYKQALFAFLARKGDRIFAVEEKDGPPAFSREQPVRHVTDGRDEPVDEEFWTGVVRRLSGLFAAHPSVIQSEVWLQASRERVFLVTSEGTAVARSGLLYSFSVSGFARAPDGMSLEHQDTHHFRDFDRRSVEAELAGRVELLAGELEALRQAPVLDPYSGPALLTPEAAGVLFHEAVGHRLEGERQADQFEGKTFKDKVGQAVIPEFLSLVDDPTLPAFEGVPLNGHYLHDDEGVPARRVDLIENGILRNYLLSRMPVKGFMRSNGHGRASGGNKPMGRMGSLFVLSSREFDDAELERRLIAEVVRQGKPFGIVIDGMTGGDTNTSSFGYQAFAGRPRKVHRLFPDGRRELVRGVEFVGTPLTSVNTIIATGRQHRVFNGVCYAESGGVPVSAIAPALLLSGIELQRQQEFRERPPLLPSPFTGRPAGVDGSGEADR